MKKLFLFATAAAVLCSCSNQPKYIIDGDIAGLAGTVYLYQGDSLIDSAVVEGGKFRFEGPADITARRTVTDSREGDAQRFGTMFFPEPGTVSIEDNPDAPAGSTRVTGTPANDASSAFRASAMTLMDEYHREGTSEGRRSKTNWADSPAKRRKPTATMRSESWPWKGWPPRFRARSCSTGSPNFRPGCKSPGS